MSTRDWRIVAPLLIAALALASGALLHLAGAGRAGDAAWAARRRRRPGAARRRASRASLLRGDVGVDLIALIAMAGALALGEYLAAIVVALMLSGGNALEAVANRRARRALTALLERAPTDARRRGASGELEVVAVERARGRRRRRGAPGGGGAGRRHAHVRTSPCSTSRR